MRQSDDNYLRRRADQQYGSNDQGYSGIPAQSRNRRQRGLSGGRYGNTAERLPRDQTQDVTPGDEEWYGLYVEEWRWPSERPPYGASGREDARYEDEWSQRSPAGAGRGPYERHERHERDGGYGGYGEPERYGYRRWQDERYEREARGYGGIGDEWDTPSQRRPAGPRNYRRDDDRIHDEVCNRLARDDELDVSDVEVRVQEGVVMLEGKVNDRRTKYDIEDIAEHVFGVQDVINHIRVQRYGLLASE
ncbi:BON domain-containing protein [Cupriavidus sp. AcVe19-1a]|uniref:BON domain-containing protein n=1 Tax=Cupriavidus sp. AcVe19-1a TaxID=2821359 RepID=UPI001AE64D2F|nr:BON domain-containing protein [Cupriavidus sp. AcVe19-1a]MBP0631554.1 BON domain-containing protein [Cupriavidus sp. AcVe19-1a]